MKVNEELSLLLVLEKARATTKDPRASITIRITIQCIRKEISLKIKIHPDKWNQEAGIAIGSSIEAREINTVIERAKAKLKRLYDILVSQHEVVTSGMLKNAYEGKTEKQPVEEVKSVSLMEAYDFVIERMEKKVEKNLRSKGTLTKWRTSKDKVIQFLKFPYKEKEILEEEQVLDMPLKKMTYSFAEDFFDFLTLEQDIGNNTAMKYVKNAKHVLTNAVSRDWIAKSPIAAFECSYVHPERDILNDEEILAMYYKQMPSKRLEEMRDAYLFMCFTGFAYKDASKLSPDHVCKFFDGEEWIVKNREKTWCSENVPLLPVAKEIIEKYRNHPYCLKHNQLLPIKSNQKSNDYLKEVAAICWIDKRLTTHTARHTFATTITLANGVPLETVSALLGHKSIKTTQIYAKIVAKKVGQDMKALKEKLMVEMPMSMQKHAA